MTTTARVQGGRPLPQPPVSSSGYFHADATWYEHEERMRPSYIQQPPISPSARFNQMYNQQQQTAYLPQKPYPETAYQQATQRTYAPRTDQPIQPTPIPGSFPNPHTYANRSRFAPKQRDDQDDMPRSTVKGSAFMHKGFWDIISLVNNQSSSSRLAVPSNSAASPSSPSRLKATLSRATGGFKRNSIDPFQAGPEYNTGRPTGGQTIKATTAAATSRDSLAAPGAWPKLGPADLTTPPSQSHASVQASTASGMGAALFGGALMGPRAQKKRISVDMVSAPRPQSFVHAAHASDAEQAEEILLRWGRDGVGKVADPDWVEPIKEALRMQAARNQAEAIAQVQAALHQESQINENPRQLHVVNGAPSQSSTITTTTVTAGHSQHTIPSPGTFKGAYFANAGPPTPRGGEAFAGIVEEGRGSDGEVVETPTLLPQTKPARPIPPASLRPGNIRINTAGTLLLNPSPATPAESGNLPDYMQYRPPSSEIPAASKAIDGLPGGAPGGINALFEPPKADRPESMVVLDSLRSIDSAGLSRLTIQPDPLRGTNIRPSLATVEKSVAAKIYFENLYFGILKKPKARDTRRAGLEAELAALRIPEAAKEQIRQAWIASETKYLRDMRARVNVNSFVKLKTIGHGAFGVVALCREKGTGELFAMKQLRKADMLRKGQEGHVRAERDLMTSASASANAKWIVKLVYSFQDVDHLYLIMEFMGGGDLLNLLIEKDIFEEDFARFYVAEMILAIHEAHSLGYIHRDIKPDNFLYSSDGHIRLADFGLCQSFHWAHDGAYYDQQRKNLLKKHGIDLEDSHAAAGVRRRANAGGNVRAGAGLDEKELNDVMSDRNPDGTPMTHVLTWREKNKKKIAYSVVGTNNYMAPEVLRGLGYDQACDWWSLGVIVFEMLFGYPPFVSKSRHLTRQKILNWRQTLRFPPKPKVSREAEDFIKRLICEREDRLGSTSSASVSRPNSVLQSARRSGFAAGPGGAGASASTGLQDGVDELMSHPWFRGIDWKGLHQAKAPYRPALSHAADTKHFEDDIEDEPLPAPGAAENPNADQPRDPMLRDKEQGQKLLEMRKQLAFVGYTFKSPKAFDPRTQLADERNIIAAEQAAAEAARGRPREPTEGGSRIRSMSM
ncbi:hypothetical protein ACQY0O_005847 [Thecaphora frezii]